MTATAPPAGDLARRFNDATKLEYINLASKPPLYKTYPGLRAISLPDAAAGGGPAMSTLAAIRGAGDSSGNADGSTDAAPLTAATLSTLLYHTGAVIRRRQLRDGAVHYRAAPSAGALYPTEMYVVCGDLDGLRAGVYHYNPLDATLSRLRNGDLRRWLAAAVGDHRAYPAALVFTTVFWRSAWKYRERGYRYCYWDLGTMAANLLATGSAEGIAAALRFGFVDRMLTGFLGIEGVAEAPSLVALLGTPDPEMSDGQLPPGSGDVPGLLPQESSDLTAGAIDYPLSRALHQASWLRTADEVAAWNAAGQASLAQDERDGTGTGDDFRPLRSGKDGRFDASIDPAAYPPAHAPDNPPDYAPDNPPSPPLGLGECIRTRGSARRFAPDAAIPWAAFRSVLDAATGGATAALPQSAGGFAPYLRLYFIVSAVDSLPPGAYYYNPFYHGLRRRRAGDFRDTAGHLGFEQALPADAAAVAFITADLESIQQDFGARGYRMAQTLAGILGGRLYLGMHALGLGATGLTFYDDAVTQFFAPHAAGQDAVFVVPMGVPHADNRVRPYRSRIAVSLDAQARGAGQAA